MPRPHCINYRRLQGRNSGEALLLRPQPPGNSLGWQSKAKFIQRIPVPRIVLNGDWAYRSLSPLAGAGEPAVKLRTAVYGFCWTFNTWRYDAGATIDQQIRKQPPMEPHRGLKYVVPYLSVKNIAPITSNLGEHMAGFLGDQQKHGPQSQQFPHQH